MGVRTGNVPRLGAGGAGYPIWRPLMMAYLQERGAEDIHLCSMTDEMWVRMRAAVRQWAREAEDAAFEAALGGGAGKDGATSSTSKRLVMSDEEKMGRKVTTARVERSERVYAILYASLPEDLRKLTEHIAAGFAYGLAQWLESKLQSTEQDKQWSEAAGAVGGRCARGGLSRSTRIARASTT